MLNYDVLPPSLVSGAKSYIEKGIKPGGFLTAVICNDLKESFGRADVMNRHCLFEIVSFWYNEAPASCWGSPEKMKAWMERFK